ncbi:ankyrin repeat domain-containing protein [Armatimonas sp.]|uniref:ankyrin repeat domain-containing protein n=1 Tax=Armatimonas sp. TaxID=1872638 RepID=UPI00286CFE9F|nr:ankyrin repeat domain-containing protein [Armatimonas sp.]
MQTPTTKQLIIAIKKHDLVTVTRLLETGADPNGHETLYTLPSIRENTEGGKPYPGDTPLLTATGFRELPMVRLLLKKGANVNVQGVNGTTPLIEAMRPDEPDIAKLLLEHGAKPDLATMWGTTALVEAAGYPSRSKHLALLIRAGANPNGVAGRTPLQAAVEIDDADNVQQLLRGGAKVNFQRPGFGTALYYAQDNADIAALLRKAGGKLRPPAREKYPNNKPSSRPSEARRQVTPREQKLTSEDSLVQECVLTDFLAYHGKDLFFLNDKATSLWVINMTQQFSVNHETQIDMDLENEQALAVTLAMRESLFARNGTSVSLADWKPNSPAIQLRDQKAITAATGRFGEKEIAARAYVRLALPGYNPQHTAAVVRFSFGPTPHGASGTYFLRQNQGKWVITWRRFAYYV